MLKRIFPLAAAIVLMTGCVSIGTNYSNTAVEHLQVGMSKVDVIKALGQPNQTTAFADGSQKLLWQFTTGTAFGATGRWVVLPFDKDGHLTDVPKNLPK